MGNGRTIGIAIGLTLVFALGIGLLAAEIYYATRRRVWKRSPTQHHHHLNNSTMLPPTMSPVSTTPTRNGNGNGNGNVKAEEDPRFLAKLFPLSSYDAYVAGGHSPLFTIKEENSSAIGDEESVGPSPPPKWPYAYSIGLLGPPPKAKANANANAKGKKRIMLLEAASPSPQPITSLDMACHVANVASASIPRTSSSSSEKSTRWCRSDYSESTASPSPPQSTWSGSERKSYSVSSAYGTPLSSPSQLARLSLSPCSSLGRSDRYVRHRNDDDQEI